MIVVARLARFVGVAGLIPFLAAIVLLIVMTEQREMVLHYFYLYSAGILAFMAGIYWPLAMQLERDRSYPVSPIVTMLLSQVFFLSAGLGLLLPVEAQIFLYTAAYAGLYIVDTKWMGIFWPDWYLKLRLWLSTIVLLCQVTAGVVFFTLT